MKREDIGQLNYIGSKTKPVIPTVFTHDEAMSVIEIIHKQDLLDGYGEVYMPNALNRKYINAAKELTWQYVFPSGRISKDPRSGNYRRHHLEKSILGKHVYKAIRVANIHKKASTHTFRHYPDNLIMPSSFSITA